MNFKQYINNMKSKTYTELDLLVLISWLLHSNKDINSNDILVEKQEWQKILKWSSIYQKGLTENHIKVLQYSNEGMNYIDIAKKMGTSHDSVKQFAVKIFDKFNIIGNQKMKQAINYAIKKGII